MSETTTPGSEWERYSTFAAPQSIAAHLADARKALRAAGRKVDRLESLLARREQEKADGTWPSCVTGSFADPEIKEAAVRHDRERAAAWGPPC